MTLRKPILAASAGTSDEHCSHRLTDSAGDQRQAARMTIARSVIACPEGATEIAQGNALGSRPKRVSRPERAKRRPGLHFSPLQGLRYAVTPGPRALPRAFTLRPFGASRPRRLTAMAQVDLNPVRAAMARDLDPARAPRPAPSRGRRDPVVMRRTDRLGVKAWRVYVDPTNGSTSRHGGHHVIDINASFGPCASCEGKRAGRMPALPGELCGGSWRPR
jgi:hypothetical protein